MAETGTPETVFITITSVQLANKEVYLRPPACPWQRDSRAFAYDIYAETWVLCGQIGMLTPALLSLDFSVLYRQKPGDFSMPGQERN